MNPYAERLQMLEMTNNLVRRQRQVIREQAAEIERLKRARKLRRSYEDERKNWTIYCSLDVPERVRSIAQQHRVSVADLANFLLKFALEEVEAGRLQVPVRVVEQAIIYDEAK